MATAITVRKYTVDVSYKINRNSVRNVDRSFRDFEKKLRQLTRRLNRGITLNIDRFTVDRRRLNTVLGDALDAVSRRVVFEVSRFIVNRRNLNFALGGALDAASSRVVFEISRFAVNDRNLQASLLRASRRVGRNLNPPNNPAPNNPPRPPQNNPPNPPQQNPRQQNPRQRVATVNNAAGAGGIAGLAARAYLPLLGLAGGGYGLAQLNQRNQQVVAAQLQAQAVSQAFGGTSAQGDENFEFLRNLGNTVGFNYLEASPDFNNLMSNLLGAGGSQEQARNIFKGFAEYGRVNKLSAARQNLVFNALSQIAGKNALQAEELTKQLGNSLPGAKSIFAEAYQKKIGGSKTGQEAIAELEAAMKKSLVKGDILNYAAQIASERAAPGLKTASQASQAEQAKFQNTITDLSIVASNSGLESGFARLFRALNDGLKEANPMVESLARGFDTASKYVSGLILSVQSLQRFFQGRDSFLGDKLFPTEESQAKAFEAFSKLKSVMEEMDKLSSNIYNGWNNLFQLIDNSTVLNKLNDTLSLLGNSANVLNKLAEGDYSDAVSSAKSAGKRFVNTITTPGRIGANAVISAATKGLAALDPRVSMDQVTPFQFGKPFDDVRSDYDWRTDYKAEQARLAAQTRNQYPLPGINQPLASGQKAIDLSMQVEVKIEAANPEDFGNKFQEHLRDIARSALLQFPVGE